MNGIANARLMQNSVHFGCARHSHIKHYHGRVDFDELLGWIAFAIFVVAVIVSAVLTVWLGATWWEWWG